MVRLSQLTYSAESEDKKIFHDSFRELFSWRWCSPGTSLARTAHGLTRTACPVPDNRLAGSVAARGKRPFIRHLSSFHYQRPSRVPNTHACVFLVIQSTCPLRIICTVPEWQCRTATLPFRHIGLRSGILTSLGCKRQTPVPNASDRFVASAQPDEMEVIARLCDTLVCGWATRSI
jgi:hypothetical protein